MIELLIGFGLKGWDMFQTTGVGSLYHLSPEQVTGKAYSGEKMDTWAIGVALFVLSSLSFALFSRLLIIIWLVVSSGWLVGWLIDCVIL